MLKHPILIAILLAALVAAGCVAGQPVSPDQMAAVAPTVVEMVAGLAPQLAGTYSVEASSGTGVSRELSLNLGEDGSVELVTQMADASQLLESGSWLMSGQGEIVLSLGPKEGESIIEPRTIRLKVEGNELVATDSVTGSELRFSPGMLAEAPSSEPQAEATAEAAAPAQAEPPAESATAGASSEPAAEPTPSTQVEPSEETMPVLERTFLSMQRAADGNALVRALTFNADGTVTMTSDYYNDKPVIVEQGTWDVNDDGTFTVSLTGQESGQMYLSPEVITFAVDGDSLKAVDYDRSVYGEEGLSMVRATDAVADETTALFNIDLQAGFPLDPTFMSVNAGGDLNAAVIAPDCVGFVNQQPVITVNWTGTADFVKAFFVSDDDPTMIVVTPDGQVYCSDDANDTVLDPVVEIQNPVEGRYQIWLGSYARNQLIPGVLVLTTNPDVNLGTFDLGAFIVRPALPEVQAEPTPVVDMDEVRQEVESRIALAQLQKLGGPTRSVEITADGTFPLQQLPLDNPLCAGLVNEDPDYVFEWPGAGEVLNIYFEGDQDATLAVLTPDEAVMCADDSADGSNRNPQVVLEDAGAGIYAVWVGRLSPEQPATGKLTISDDASAGPAVLAGQ